MFDNGGDIGSVGTIAVQLTHKAAGPNVTRTASAGAVVTDGSGPHIFGWLADAGLLLLVVIAFPLMILIVGTPIALLVRLLTEIGRRW